MKYWPRHFTWKPKRFGLVWWEKRVSSRAHGAQTIDKFRDPQRHRARTLPYIGSCHDHQSRPRPPLTSGTRRITRRGNNPVAVRRAVAARLVGPSFSPNFTKDVTRTNTTVHAQTESAFFFKKNALSCAHEVGDTQYQPKEATCS